jgi:RNA polymerase sigma-70 factor (ECF subfamily)
MLNEHDQLRFMRLWTAAQPAVAGYVHALVGDRAAAEDIVQETSIVLFRRFAEYQQDRPFIAWAMGIAKFQVLGMRRDDARSRVIFDDDLLARFTESWAELAPQASERSLVLQECIEQLASHARRLVRMRYFDDQTAEQIAVRLGGTGAAVRVAIQRIRRQLRDCVDRKLRVEGEAT